MQSQGSINKARGSILPDDKWHCVGEAGEPAFENSWTNFGSSCEEVKFIKTAAGVVFITGIAKGGTIGQTVFTLPVGYRLRGDGPMGFPTVSNDAIGRIVIDVDGTVDANVGNNTYFDLAVSCYVG